MTDLTVRSPERGPRALSDSAVRDLRAHLSGNLITPGIPGYDEARSVWNAMIDRRPALIVRCLTAADVQLAVNLVREHDLLVSVRGGGHNIAGSGVCEGGVMIDLSQMNEVVIDAEARRARVGPGARLADLDRAGQPYGLATPTGINSTTGIAGLTLGGGFGWLTRRYGMTIDNLLSVEVVTADGEIRRAGQTENPELFWALRGGGGNFGVVTSFEYRMHPVGDVFAGLVVYPLDEAPEVLRRWRDFTEQAPDEVTVWALMRKAPPLPFLPASWHGRGVLVLVAFASGDPEDGARLTAPVLGFGHPVATQLGVQPYADFQTGFDPLLTPGARNYWKSHDFRQLTDEALDRAVEQARQLPSPHCEVFFGQLGGAMGRIAPDATAYGGRDARYVMNVHGRWERAEDDALGIAWARSVFETMAPYAAGTAYVNFMTEEEGDRVKQAYGVNYERLAEVKRRYDPGNLFRANMNIRPAEA